MRVLTPSPKRVPSGRTRPARPPGLEDLHEEDEEEVGRLAGAELGGEVGLDAVLLHAAKGRVGDDDVHSLLRAPVAQGAGEGVVVADVGGDVDAVEEQVGHAEDVRQVLFLDAREAVLDGALVGLGLGLLAQVLDGADEKAARCRRRGRGWSRRAGDSPARR